MDKQYNITVDYTENYTITVTAKNPDDATAAVNEAFDTYGSNVVRCDAVDAQYNYSEPVITDLHTTCNIKYT